MNTDARVLFPRIAVKLVNGTSADNGHNLRHDFDSAAAISFHMCCNVSVTVRGWAKAGADVRARLGGLFPATSATPLPLLLLTPSISSSTSPPFSCPDTGFRFAARNCRYARLCRGPLARAILRGGAANHKTSFVSGSRSKSLAVNKDTPWYRYSVDSWCWWLIWWFRQVCQAYWCRPKKVERRHTARGKVWIRQQIDGRKEAYQFGIVSKLFWCVQWSHTCVLWKLLHLCSTSNRHQSPSCCNYRPIRTCRTLIGLLLLLVMVLLSVHCTLIQIWSRICWSC